MAIVPVPPESTRKEQVTKPLPWLSGVKETVNYIYGMSSWKNLLPLELCSSSHLPVAHLIPAAYGLRLPSL